MKQKKGKEEDRKGRGGREKGRYIFQSQINPNFSWKLEIRDKFISETQIFIGDLY